MNPLLTNQKFELLTLENIIVTPGPLFEAVLDLYQTGPVFDPATCVFTDFTLCDYAGYAQVELAWDDPSVSDDGHVETHSNQATFRPTDATDPETAIGYLVRDAAGNLIAGGTFENGPLPLQSALDVIKMTLVFRLDGEGLVSVVS